MSLTQDEIRDIFDAMDCDDVDRLADLNGSAPELAAAMQKRFGCTIELVALGAEGQRLPVRESDLAAYRAAVAVQGGGPDAIRSASLAKTLRPYDVVSTINGFGSSGKIRHLRDFLQEALHAQSRLILDIKLGSGSYPFLNAFGTCNTLIEPAKDRPGRAILSATPPSSNSGQWSRIARELAGDRGFFTTSATIRCCSRTGPRRWW